MAFELPEAFTVARQMNGELKGKTIARLHLGPQAASLVRQGFINLAGVDLSGQRIGGVSARGKWIFVALPEQRVLLLALETGGKILYHPPSAIRPPSAHLLLELDNGSTLTEHITGWGWAKIHTPAELEKQAYPGPPGIDPLDAAFTLALLGSILAASPKKNLRQFLIAQQPLAGIGNGYLQDILYGARLHPGRKAGSLSESEVVRLHAAIQGVLGEALRLGGSAFEVDLYGHPGGYPRSMGTHRLGRPCPVCGAVVEKVSVGGGACAICPVCQPA